MRKDSIEGTLYNEDGTEYKPPKPVTPPKPAATYTPPKPQPKPQMSLFELMENNANEEKPSENMQDVSQKQNNRITPIRTTKNRAMMPKRTKNRPKKNCERLPKRRKTCRCLQYPRKRKPFRCRARPSISGICEYRTSIPVISSCSAAEISTRHSAYEALGKGAQILSENLALTLTGRDCGLLERVPMTGIPHHAVDNYIGKAIECGLKIVLADSSDSVKVYPQHPAVPVPEKVEKPTVLTDPPAEEGKHWIDEKTYVDDDGLAHNAEKETDSEDDEPAFDMSAYDTEALAILDELFGNEIILR